LNWQLNEHFDSTNHVVCLIVVLLRVLLVLCWLVYWSNDEPNYQKFVNKCRWKQMQWMLWCHCWLLSSFGILVTKGNLSSIANLLTSVQQSITKNMHVIDKTTHNWKWFLLGHICINMVKSKAVWKAWQRRLLPLAKTLNSLWQNCFKIHQSWFSHLAWQEINALEPTQQPLFDVRELLQLKKDVHHDADKNTKINLFGTMRWVIFCGTQLFLLARGIKLVCWSRIFRHFV